MHANQVITYRNVTEIRELHEAVYLQQTTWEAGSVTSVPQMAAAILHGGVVIGAFEGSRMVGFCYGFAGFNGKEIYLGSHMMAIHPDFRDRGIGMKLKLEQSKWAKQFGYGKIVWTFDPFEPRNAYLNLCKLGGTVGTYIPSFYGEDKLRMPTDRFVVEWDLASERKERSNEPLQYPSALDCDRDGERVTEVRRSEFDVQAGHNNAGGFLIPIPRAAHELKNGRPELFVRWQSELRRLCSEAFACGYRVVSFIREAGPVHYYVLERRDEA